MKRIIITLSVLLVLSGCAYSQGCVAIRNITGFGQFAQLGYGPSTDKWMLDINNRYFEAYRFLDGKKNITPGNLSSGVTLYEYTMNLELTRVLQNGWAISLDMPVSSNKTYGALEHASGDAHSTHAFGIGDIRFTVYKWLLNAATARKGNIQVGLGIKFPTGNYHTEDYFYTSSSDKTYKELAPVNVAVQLGDGGTGITTQLNAFYIFSPNISIYGNFFYLISPKDVNGVASWPPGLLPADAITLFHTTTYDVNSVPDGYINLGDKTINADDLFSYNIPVLDEENNFPFKINISFVSCATGSGDCNLFSESQYSINYAGGSPVLYLRFTPGMDQLGWYLINFSAEDNNSRLGNSRASRLVNFTVVPSIWNDTLVLNYSGEENQPFFLNFSDMVLGSGVSFTAKNAFQDFRIDSGGVLQFTPDDPDVGFNSVEVIASRNGANSSRIFNFTISNVNDNVSIESLKAGSPRTNVTNATIATTYENMPVRFFLYLRDDDFNIPQNQRAMFYDEQLNLTTQIEGPNETLFSFYPISSFPFVQYGINFTARRGDVGEYNITVNVSDKSGSKYTFDFNLTILNMSYNTPNITYPGENATFALKENETFNFIFAANHTVGDNLIYNIYFNDTLKNSTTYYGNGTNLTWRFTPNFTDETHGIEKLRLEVVNSFYSDINASREWNLTIAHTNAPVVLKSNIMTSPTSYLYNISINLSTFFEDVDNGDPFYNQTINYTVQTNASPSYISRTINGTTLILSSRIPVKEIFNLTAEDLDESNNTLTSVVSNNFVVEFTNPQVIEVPKTTSGGGGGTAGAIGTPVSLKLIMPGSVSAYEHEKIVIPLKLFNGAAKSFDGILLSSSAFKDGNISSEVKTSLEKTNFSSLAPGKEENFNLTVFFDTDKLGDYEVLVNVSAKSPVYTDWGKININLQAINESQVRDQILFTEEFIVKNPQCIEIKEMVDEANAYFEKGDYANAKAKTESALRACSDAIAQVSYPRTALSKYFSVSLYLIGASFVALLLGLAYYFLSRRKFQNIKPSDEEGQQPIQKF